MLKAPVFLLLIASLCVPLGIQAADSGSYKSPEKVAGTETVSLATAKQMHRQGTLFVDVRSPRQFKKRHIPGAINLYIKDGFSEQNLLKHAAKDTPLVLYCNGIHCSLSYKAAEKAVDWGFSNIKYFREGFRSWRLDGNQLEYGVNTASN